MGYEMYHASVTHYSIAVQFFQEGNDTCDVKNSWELLHELDVRKRADFLILAFQLPVGKRVCRISYTVLKTHRSLMTESLPDSNFWVTSSTTMILYFAKSTLG